MGRRKGSLTAEHKARMQAGRKSAKAKTLEGIIPIAEKTKKIKREAKIIGYAKDNEGHILPIFDSEKDLYKKIYKTFQEAKESEK